MKGSDPDAPLVQGVAAGDPRATHALVQSKLPKLHGLAMRMLGDSGEAEDVAQEVLLRAWRHAPRWRDDGRARFDTWLHTVTMNLCRDRLRRRRERPVAEMPEQADSAPLADSRMAAQEASRRVKAALDELPPRQREAILLHHYQDLSNPEAARVLGVSLEALESLLGRGRRALRALLSGVEL